MSEIPCRVWAFRNDSGPETTELSLLNSDEKDHASRLKSKSDRDAFIKTRVALRRIVGREAGVSPSEVVFQHNSWGKPSVAIAVPTPIDFSVSHTRGLSAIALTRGTAVGVDIEPFRPCPDKIRITADVFGLNVAQQLLAVEERRQDAVFLGLWTAGEALIKARGLGFAGTSGKVPVCLRASGPEIVVLGNGSKDRWAMTPLDLGPDFVGHVVVGAPSGFTQDSSIDMRGATDFRSR